VKRIAYTAAARRSLRKLPADVRDQVEARLRRYAETGEGDVKHLIGREGARLRIGDYRIIFVETFDEIDVLALGNSREIYR
jgi:mRNA interferase RelE/StbE